MAHGRVWATPRWTGAMWAGLLADHLADGTALDLLCDRPAGPLLTEREMWAWGGGHDLDAALLRDVLSGRSAVAAPGACPRALWLRGARIWGRLDLDGLSSTIALTLEDCLLDQGLTARGAHLGALTIRRCRVGHSELALPAFDGTGIRVDDALSISESLLVNAGPAAAVGLADAWIGAGFDAGGAALRSADGPGLVGSRLHTRGGAHLDQGFDARGCGAAVDLVAARIGGELSLDGAQLHGTAGPALAAQALHTGHDLHADRLSARGAGPGGVIGLAGARIGGSLRADGARWENSSGPALVAARLEIAGDLALTGLTAAGAGPEPTVGLDAVRVGGRLDCATAWVSNATHPRHQWTLDGLTYTGVPRLNPHGPRPNRDAWIALLQTATPGYAAAPYRHLAAAYRDSGRDRDARAVLLAQRRDHCARATLAPGERGRARLAGLLVGYGYQPWRALVGLLAVVAVSITITVVLGAHGALAPTPAAGDPRPVAASCRPLVLVGEGLDVGIPWWPSARSGPEGCEPTTGPTGTALTISRWVLQLAAWSLLAVFLATVARTSGRRWPSF